jgi:uncharacterized protein
MEAARVGAREADVAPAPPAAASTGWVPANPAPVGAGGFAATTFVLSLINANLISARGVGVVLGLALVYGGLAQLLAGMWEFRTGNTFGACVFTSFGAFWISVYFILNVVPPILVTQSGLSAYFYAWTIFALILFLASLRTTGALSLAILLLFVTVLLLAIGHANLVGSTALTNNWIKAGGWVGIVLAIVAWYIVLAALMNSTFGREILPTVPLQG